jgi:hypothetical protein
MLTLLALRATKALLIACKEVVDLPQGRILDAAVEKYAIEILGVRKVRQIQRAMRDPAKAALLTREPRTDDVTASETPARAAAKPVRARTNKQVTGVRAEKNAPARVSFLRETPETDE